MATPLIPLLVVPCYQMLKFVRQPGRMRKVKKARTAGFFAVAGATLAGILLIPTPLRVQGTLVLTAAKPAQIYAEVPGRLVSLEVRDNQWVAQGTVLAKLSNPEKFRERLEREDKYWKWSDNDMKEREHWDAYQRAYEEAIDATSTPQLRAGNLYYTIANTNHAPSANFDAILLLTVTNDVGTAVKEYAAGKIEFRNDAGGNVHSVVGKLSFDKNKLVDNINAMVAHIRKMKPPTSKGHYVKRVVLKSSMSPAVHLQIA